MVYLEEKKKKISLMRSIYKNIEFLIFDEPESNLDFKSVLEFNEFIDIVMRDNLIIIITHDKEWLYMAVYVTDL